MKRNEIYEQTLRSFIGVPYEWGGASKKGSDCSGTVCQALTAAYGKKIRVTADFLYRNIFVFKENDSALKAAFFLDSTGKAVHVAGCCGKGLYLNQSRREADSCAHFRTKEELKAMYSDLTMVIRTTDSGDFGD